MTVVVSVAPFTPAVVPALAQSPVAVESTPLAVVQPATVIVVTVVPLSLAPSVSTTPSLPPPIVVTSTDESSAVAADTWLVIVVTAVDKDVTVVETLARSGDNDAMAVDALVDKEAT